MVSKNATPFFYFLLFILGIETIVAFLGNGFIIAVNGHRWLQSRKMLPSDLLLTALGATRFLLPLIIMTSNLLYFYTSESFCNIFFQTFFIYSWAYMSLASVWCATLLSVLYCVKITNFTHCLFLWLKPKIDVLMPRLLGLSLILFSLPFAASRVNIMNYCSPTGNLTGNVSQEEETNKYYFGIFLSLHNTFIAINVSICLTASILLLISLWRHTRNLKRSGIATKDFNTQAHVSVVYFLLSFLFFYIFYAVSITFSLTYFRKLSSVEGMISNAVQALCPSAHSIILILANPKLKEVFMQILKIRQKTS